MSFFKTTDLSKLFYPIIILSLLTFSCSTDNSITQSSNDIRLEKTSSIYSEEPWALGPFINSIAWIYPGVVDNCILYLELYAPYLLGDDSDSGLNSKYSSLFENREMIIDNSYDFRDSYLNQNDKGKIYTYCYYKLSEYSIANNIIGEFYRKHMNITPICLDIANELQNSSNASKILFNESIYSDLKEIVKIYRDSENHKDIDVVLDYLDTDLEKYVNKTKSEIADDFGF